jgi:hypothetical protein
LLQRTHVQHVQKGLVSDASRLLGLEGLEVQRVESDAFGGRVVHVVTADKTASACPSCGVLSVTLKGLACTQCCARGNNPRSLTRRLQAKLAHERTASRRKRHALGRARPHFPRPTADPEGD